MDHQGEVCGSSTGKVFMGNTLLLCSAFILEKSPQCPLLKCGMKHKQYSKWCFDPFCHVTRSVSVAYKGYTYALDDSLVYIILISFYDVMNLLCLVPCTSFICTGLHTFSYHNLQEKPTLWLNTTPNQTHLQQHSNATDLATPHTQNGLWLSFKCHGVNNYTITHQSTESHGTVH